MSHLSRGLRLALALAAVSALGAGAASAQPDCSGLPGHAALTTALKGSVKASGGPSNGGLDLHMWATVVNRGGEVCAVTRTGDGPGDQWPGSRVISAQKANTANAFSLPGLALSTANLWAATQPGGSLFGLQFSNPVDTDVAYAGSAASYGTEGDAMTGQKVGGVNVFGGGLALYDEDGIVGALGVSGDTSCADHNIAWRTRAAQRSASTRSRAASSPTTATTASFTTSEPTGRARAASAIPAAAATRPRWRPRSARAARRCSPLACGPCGAGRPTGPPFCRGARPGANRARARAARGARARRER